MSKFNYTFLLLIIFLQPHSLLSQLSAITSGGKEVVLYNDGSWEYLKEDTLILSIKHFRNSNWGDSQESVLKSESLEVLENLSNEYRKVYKETIADINMLVVYNFTQNKLTNTMYVFQDKHTNKNSFIDDFNKLKNILSEKYGTPTKEDVNWGNDLYRDDYSDWGKAISIGHLTYFAEWETDATIINIVLTGENYEISTGISYRSKTLKELTEQAKSKSLEGKF